MRIDLTINELEQIHQDGEERYLAAKGFNVLHPILRLEHHDEIGMVVSGISFHQDETPDVGGDNIEVELLKSMS
jgi:hypothetical protein